MYDYFSNFFENTGPHDFVLNMAALRTKAICKKWLLEQKERPISPPESTPDFQKEFYEQYNTEFLSFIDESLQKLDELCPDDSIILDAMNELYESTDGYKCDELESIISNAEEKGTLSIMDEVEKFRSQAKDVFQAHSLDRIDEQKKKIRSFDVKSAIASNSPPPLPPNLRGRRGRSRTPPTQRQREIDRWLDWERVRKSKVQTKKEYCKENEGISLSELDKGRCHIKNDAKKLGKNK